MRWGTVGVVVRFVGKAWLGAAERDEVISIINSHEKICRS